jgi:hypothetical protein
MEIMDYLDQRLIEWADWYLRQNDHGLGYPKKSIEARLMELGGFLIKMTGHYYPPSHTNAEEIEDYIRELAKQNRILADTLRSAYLGIGTGRQKAKRMQLSYTQFKVYLGMAKQWLAGRFSVGKHYHSDHPVN